MPLPAIRNPLPPPGETSTPPRSSSADSVCNMAVALLSSSPPPPSSLSSSSSTTDNNTNNTPPSPDSDQDAIILSFLDQRRPSHATIAHAVHLVEYRIATMDLVDLFVSRLDLPRPGAGQMCAAWTPTARLPEEVSVATTMPSSPPLSSPEGESHGSPGRKKKKPKRKHESRFDQLVGMLRTHGFETLLASHHGCGCECCKHYAGFERPTYYMAACLEMTCIQVDEVPQFIAHLSAVMALYEEEDLHIPAGCRLASARDVSKRELEIRKRGLRRVVHSLHVD